MFNPSNETHFSLTADDFKDELQVLSFTGTEGISQPFRFDLELVSENPDIDLETLLHKQAFLAFDPQGSGIHGQIYRVAQGDAGNRLTHYKVSLVPQLEYLRHRTNQRIYQQLSAPRIIALILEEHGIQGNAYRFQLGTPCPDRDYCVQYDESDLHFTQARSEGVLRDYNPRMFVPVCETLTPAQGQAFHTPVIVWHWLDRDQQAQSLPGNYVRHAPPPVIEAFMFDHPQVANLLAWTEADNYRIERCATPQDYGMSRKEGLIRHLFHSQLAANKKGLKEPEERQPFIQEWLLDNSPFVIDEPPRPLI